MASSTGTTSSPGSSSGLLQNSGSEEDLQQVMEQRKRKRMISNRESARRSRLRKQKHLDDLMSQVGRLRKENNQIITSINVTTQHYLNVEAENSILRAQVSELSHRLQSLIDIINLLNPSSDNTITSGCFGTDQDPTPPPPPPPPSSYGHVADQLSADGIINSCLCNYPYVSQLPFMACANMLQY